MTICTRILKKATLLSLLVCVLSGCVSNKTEVDLVVVFDETTGTTNDSVAYEVKRDYQNLSDLTIIEFTLENQTAKKLYTSYYYWIERKNNEEWEEIPFYAEFEDVEIQVEPNDEVELVFALELYEDHIGKYPIELEAGRYRMRKEYSWDIRAKNQVINDLFIEFDIQEEEK